jgi:poly [ADP-ribose] polymerase
LDWLIESDKAKKPLPEKSYVLGADSKDSKSDAKDGDTEKPEKKKRTLEEALEIEEDGANKKPKDGQKKGAKSVVVPVDDCCYLRSRYTTPTQALLHKINSPIYRQPLCAH